MRHKNLPQLSALLTHAAGAAGQSSPLIEIKAHPGLHANIPKYKIAELRAREPIYAGKRAEDGIIRMAIGLRVTRHMDTAEVSP
jgi:hypothetical protein